MYRTRILVASLLVGLGVPFFSSAATVAELQAQLATLQQQVAALISRQNTAALSSSNGLASCPNLLRNLSRSSRGNDVKQLQQFLISQNLLASDSATGFFGSLTEHAVQQWQAKNSIVSSGASATTGFGAVGPKTRAAMAACTVPRTSTATSAQPSFSGSPSPIPPAVPTPNPTPAPGLSLTPTPLPTSITVPMPSSPSPAPTPPLPQLSPPPSTSSDPQVVPSLPTLSISSTFGITASWAGNTFTTASYATPLGWGYMNPTVVVNGSDYYVPAFYPCDDSTRHVYCLYVFKNGAHYITPNVLVMGTGGGDTGTVAYQTPSIFYFDNKIIAVYWYMDANNVSSIAIDAVDLSPTVDQRIWTRLGTHKSAGGKWVNYLGAAMGRDGTIYIAGYGSVGERGSLELLRARPPFSQVESGPAVLAYETKAYQPLYPHVAVKSDGTIGVFFVLANGLSCPQYNSSLTAYKTTALYQGQWGQPFSGVWSNAPSDTLASPDTNGSNCAWRNAHFPLDLIYSSSDNSFYALERVEDTENVVSNAQTVPQNPWTRKFAVWKNGNRINADISSAFASVFPLAKDIDAMSMTQLSSGVFVVFANNRSTTGPFAIVTTKDFQTFSAAQSVSTPFGSGHSIKVGQGYKNTTGGVDQIVYYHSGRLNDSFVDLPNYHLQYRAGVGTVQ